MSVQNAQTGDAEQGEAQRQSRGGAPKEEDNRNDALQRQRDDWVERRMICKLHALEGKGGA